MNDPSPVLLSQLEAAHYLGITPELLTHYMRPSFSKGGGQCQPLISLSVGGKHRFRPEDLDAFDEFLHAPWSDDKRRPAIPDAIVAHLKAECRNQCARCGSGNAVETAHIISWSICRSHHHHNLIRLCSACHRAHDLERTVTSEELRSLKERLIAATRANLLQRIKGGAGVFAPPRPSAAFFGRVEQSDGLVAALQAGKSILITGAGGIGKTELLLQAIAAANLDRAIIWLDAERYSSAAGIIEALHIALSLEGEPCTAENACASLDDLRACVVLDGIEQGALDDLDQLEDAISRLHAGTQHAQFVSTSQVSLHRLPSELRIKIDRLDDSSSRALLVESYDDHLFNDGDALDQLLALCDGHPLTLRLAGALTEHFGGIAPCLRVIHQRGANVVAIPGRGRQDRSSSLKLCLSVAFESLSFQARQALWLISNAPGGLLAAQFESDYFGLGVGPDPVAELRRWHLIYSQVSDRPERLQCLSPIRLFTAQWWMAEQAGEAARLKAELQQSIGIMVAVIEDGSEEADQIGYMIERYSEEMPNVRWLIEEAVANPGDSDLAFLALGVCASLMRYFFVLRLTKEGAAVMEEAADLALATGRPDRAAAFVTQMVGLSRGDRPEVAAKAESFIKRIEASAELAPHEQGDLLVAKTMIALDEGCAERAEAHAHEALNMYRRAAKTIRDRQPDDTSEPDEELITIRTNALHNDIASALKLLGDAQLALGQFAEAAKSYRHSLGHERGASVAVNIGQLQHQIGNCEGRLGNHQEAAECYLKALTVFYLVGMREFLSNASCELGFTLLECDPPLIHKITDEGYAATLNDVALEIGRFFEGPLDPQHCAKIARKTFGTLIVGILSGKAQAAGEWAYSIATELLSPRVDGRPQTSDAPFCMRLLDAPLHIAFLVAEVEASKDATGDADRDAQSQLLAACCELDSWTREMLRIPDMLATYFTRCLGITNADAGRIREFMTNYDDGVHDHLDLERRVPGQPHSGEKEGPA